MNGPPRTPHHPRIQELFNVTSTTLTETSHLHLLFDKTKPWAEGKRSGVTAARVLGHITVIASFQYLPNLANQANSPAIITLVDDEYPLVHGVDILPTGERTSITPWWTEYRHQADRALPDLPVSIAAAALHLGRGTDMFTKPSANTDGKRLALPDLATRITGVLSHGSEQNPFVDLSLAHLAGDSQPGYAMCQSPQGSLPPTSKLRQDIETLLSTQSTQ